MWMICLAENLAKSLACLVAEGADKVSEQKALAGEITCPLLRGLPFPNA
jgi:hypothetical protein